MAMTVECRFSHVCILSIVLIVLRGPPWAFRTPIQSSLFVHSACSLQVYAPSAPSGQPRRVSEGNIAEVGP